MISYLHDIHLGFRLNGSISAIIPILLVADSTNTYILY